jgi:hypothetical protein
MPRPKNHVLGANYFCTNFLTCNVEKRKQYSENQENLGNLNYYVLT